MSYSKFKDIKNRRYFLKKEKNKLISKFLFLNFVQGLNLKTHSDISGRILQLCLKLNASKRVRFNSKTKLTRRCVISNRNRSVYRPFGFSRIVLKNFIHLGILPGYRKAVW